VRDFFRFFTSGKDILNWLDAGCVQVLFMNPGAEGVSSLDDDAET
jgi:hypothetical protein